MNSATLFRNGRDWLCFSLQCLVTCGNGHKHRQVWCQFGEDRLNDRICDPETKPASMQTCQQPECASWQAGPWGQVFCTITFLTTFFLSLSGEGLQRSIPPLCCVMWLVLCYHGTGSSRRICIRFAPHLRAATFPLEQIIPSIDSCACLHP